MTEKLQTAGDTHGHYWIVCWNCIGEGIIEDDDPGWPPQYTCETCKGHGGWKRPEEKGQPHE